ncbi:two-component sensor histidine kinase [Inquilinus ginsengisoli]|uniref:sensor histidine kinase n=1 Tax=Inquilinus ginsengisoli TaxID=363840 RepID=UPI003D21AC94
MATGSSGSTMTTALITAIDTREERDVIAARQRVRLVATELGFDGRDRVRIVAAASAMTRSFLARFEQANLSLLVTAGPPMALEIVLAAPRRPLGQGQPQRPRLDTAAVRALMDSVELRHARGVVRLVMRKELPASAGRDPTALAHRTMAALADETGVDPFEEVHRQTVEQIASLTELRQREEQLIAANAQLREVERALRASLEEKDVLMREVHHRVNNNLQIISSLLNLQASRATEPAVREELAVVGHRIQSLSLVHQKLYHSDDLSHIDAGGYVQDLCAHLQSAFAAGTGPVALTVEAPHQQIPLDNAIHLGLIVNELVTNSLKHGFRDGRGGHIAVSLQRTDDDSLTLTIVDDGRPDDGSRRGFGMTLVEAMVRRLDGILTIDRNGGTRTTLTVPVPKSAPQIRSESGL